MIFDFGWHWKVKSRSLGVHWVVYNRQCIIRHRSCQAERPLVSFWHEASLGWHYQHIIRRIWLNRSKGNLYRSKLCPFCTLDHILKKLVSIFFLYFGMNLPKDGTNQLPKAGFDWIALKVIFQGRKGLNLPLFSNLTLIVKLFIIWPVTFSLFWHEASPGWWQWTVKRRIWLNHSKGHCQGQKGPVWLIFPYFYILINSIEVLPKCIASCSFSEVILVLFSNFNDVDWF